MSGDALHIFLNVITLLSVLGLGAVCFIDWKFKIFDPYRKGDNAYIAIDFSLIFFSILSFVLLGSFQEHFGQENLTSWFISTVIAGLVILLNVVNFIYFLLVISKVMVDGYLDR